MRHTLLPDHERAALRREYRIRALVVFLFVLSVAGLIGIASLFPAFVSASSEERRQIDAFASLKKGGEDADAALAKSSLASDSVLLGALSADAGAPAFSRLIDRVVSVRGPVALSSVSAVRGTDGSFAFVVQGVAPTRELLLSFQSRLEGIAPGTKVDLPISELAASTDIRFSLQITQTPQ